jgi:DNA topoisomerase-2
MSEPKSARSLTQIQHVLQRPEQWGAHNSVEEVETIIGVKTMNLLLAKMVDEIVSNAYDQRKSSSGVDIKLQGDIVIVQTDTCMNVSWNDECNAYNPQVCFGKLLSGTNFDGDRSGVGTYGIGSKLTNIWSERFQVDAVTNGTRYVQTWKNNMGDVSEPVITKVDAPNRVLVAFKPDAKRLVGYTTEMLRDVVCSRATQIAYVMPTRLQGEQMNCRFPDLVETPIHIRTKLGEYWVGPGTLRYVLVNNQKVDKGTHLTWLANHVIAHARAKFESVPNLRVTPLGILDRMSVVGYVDAKNIEFGDGQSKSKLKSPRESEFGDISKNVLQAIVDIIMSGVISKAVAPKRRRVQPKIDNLMDAKYAGDAKRALECTLIVTEGDSARGPILMGQNTPSVLSDLTKTGIITLNGKIQNVLKAMRFRTNAEGRRSPIYTVRNDEENRESAKISKFMAALGLEWTGLYDREEEFRTLRYGRLVIAADQDTDGNHIVSLVMCLLATGWPALLRRPFLYKLNTPIVETRYNGQMLKFYSQSEYDTWATGKPRIPTPKYFKGLGLHDESSISEIFRDIESHLVEYRMDHECVKTLRDYMGTESGVRKQLLVTPVVDEPFEVISKGIATRGGKLTGFMHDKLKEYYQDAAVRGLIHVIDGLNPTRRKVLACAISGMQSYGKVVQYANRVAYEMKYHHGDASLNAVVTAMGMEWPGSNIYPLLLIKGNAGTRAQGPSGAASERYIETRLNSEFVNAMFPRADDELLTPVVVDGAECEPMWYLPVLPMSIMENRATVATGWKSQIHARRFEDLYELTRKLITEIDPPDVVRTVRETPLGHYVDRNGCDMIYSGAPIYIGKFKVKSEAPRLEVVITELPPRMWVNKYANEMQKREDVRRVFNGSKISTNTAKINIEITFNHPKSKIMSEFKPSPTVIRHKIDPLASMLGIVDVCRDEINMIGPDTISAKVSNYHDVYLTWYVHRGRAYAERVTRMRILLKYRIARLVDQNRYCSIHIGNVEESVAVRTLEIEKFAKYNNAVLTKPGHIKTTVLETTIITGGNYNHLLDLRDRDKLAHASETRAIKIKDMESQLKKLCASSRFPGSTMWLEELDHLKTVVDKARARGGWYVPARR